MLTRPFTLTSLFAPRQKRTTIADLPVEVLFKIFQHLMTLQDLRSFGLTDKAHLAIFQDIFYPLNTLNSRNSFLYDKAARQLAHLSSVLDKFDEKADRQISVIARSIEDTGGGHGAFGMFSASFSFGCLMAFLTSDDKYDSHENKILIYAAIGLALFTIALIPSAILLMSAETKKLIALENRLADNRNSLVQNFDLLKSENQISHADALALAEEGLAQQHIAQAAAPTNNVTAPLLRH